MENTADSNDGFPDLLSAALNESGLTDDWCYEDTGTGVVPQPSKCASNAGVPVPLASQGYGGAGDTFPPSVIRLPVTSGTPGIKNGGVKKIIVRAVTPQSLMGKKLVLTGASSSPLVRPGSGVRQVLSGSPSGIRVIRLPSNQLANLSAHLSGQLTSGSAKLVVSSAPKATLTNCVSSVPVMPQTGKSALLRSTSNASQAQSSVLASTVLQPAAAVASHRLASTSGTQPAVQPHVLVSTGIQHTSMQAAPLPSASRLPQHAIQPNLPQSVCATTSQSLRPHVTASMPSTLQPSTSSKQQVPMQTLTLTGNTTLSTSDDLVSVSAVQCSMLSTCTTSTVDSDQNSGSSVLNNNIPSNCSSNCTDRINVNNVTDTLNSSVKTTVALGCTDGSLTTSGTAAQLSSGVEMTSAGKDIKQENEQETNSSHDDDDDSLMTDVDIFSQALLDLADTNKEADQYVASHQNAQQEVTSSLKSLHASKPVISAVSSCHTIVPGTTLSSTGRTGSPITLLNNSTPAAAARPQMNTIRLSINQPSNTIRVPFNQMAGTVRLQQTGGAVRIPNSQPTSTIRVPINQISSAIRIPQTSGTIRVPLSQTSSTIRLPLNQTAGTIRLPVSQSTGGGVVRLPQSIGPVSHTAASIPVSIIGNKLVHIGGHAGSIVVPSGVHGQCNMLPAGSVLSVKRSASPNLPAVRPSVVKSLLLNNESLKRQLSDKDVSRIWANEEIKLKKLAQVNTKACSPMGVGDNYQELEEEADELGQAETYANYMPLKSKVGERHPDPVVETNSLSSVEPHDIWYHLSISESIIDYGYLSALQLEAIVYACQKHQTILPSGERAGYLIGDGAGVGKGRTIAGIIQENYLQGRKRALWLSVSNDLRVDAERDLRDIGASKIEVYPLNKFKYAKISSHINNSVKKGVIFATYSSLIGESQSECKYRTRLKQLVHWLGTDFDGPIIFDECHKAKNLCPVGSSKPTKTGMTVLELQNRLPKARIVYASATGASEPKNMAYMTRLGLWGPGTPFKEFSDFIQAVEKRGVGAMELVAMDMKLRGMYIARQLSFQGVTFRIVEIPVQAEFKDMYNAAVKLWVEARSKFQAAADLIDAEQRMKKGMWAQFWSAHQRFFKYLCISSKVSHCLMMAREAIKHGKCVVIGLQSTGEARTLEQVEDCGGELTDFVSTAKGVIQTLVEKHFPAPDRKKTADWFGGNLFEDSPSSSPAVRGQKRKNNGKPAGVKKPKNSRSDDSESEESTKASGSDCEESAEESDAAQDSDEFNPFGDGSDSDEDPWLKRQKKMANKKKKKKKEKMAKKKKNKKKKKAESDSDDDIDKQFDKALEAAGLMGKSEQKPFEFGSSMRSSDGVTNAIAMKDELLLQIEKLGERLPANTLDELIDSLGGPDAVAEMTGRKGRVVSTENGNIQYESRSETDAPLEILNLTEKQRFMDGEKDIAIISEAASSGISLQADRRAINQKRRVHITLELPWSADRAIQQFGRTHRSNQVSAPEYLFLISDLAGERRFACTVAKRLESLGALTHGDRRATESRDLSRFNVDNKYGRAALESMMKSIVGLEPAMIPPPDDYVGDFYKDAREALVGVGLVTSDEKYGIFSLEKEYNNINKFLNRLLGIQVDLQNCIFKYFMDTLTAIILQAKRNGRWDMGILDLGSGGEDVKRVQSKTFVFNVCGTTTKTELHTLSVERGMSWSKAMEIWEENSGAGDGFYLSIQARGTKRLALLAVAVAGKKRERLYAIHRPNTRLQPRYELLSELTSKNRKVLPDEAKPHWETQHSASSTVCTHAYWGSHCKKASMGLTCEIGLRSRTYHVLSGSVLSVWNKVESVLASVARTGSSSRMQLIRLKTDEGKRIVGSLIPNNALKPLIQVLSESSSKSYNTQHAMLPSEMRSANDLLTNELNSAVSSDQWKWTGQNSTNRLQTVASPINTDTNRQVLSMPMLL